MKPHRGLPLHPNQSRLTLGRLIWTAVGPFITAALLGSVLFRASRLNGKEEVWRPEERILEQTGQHPAGHAAAATQGGDGGGEIDGNRRQLFLFIGILSGRGYRHRRLAVREAWSTKAQVSGQVVARFILSEDERTPQVEKELEAYGDIVFVREKTNYKSILYKTYYVMEYAATNYDAAFVLKTDDDAFINVVPLMAQLAAMCENPGCRNERVYLGKMAKHSEVLLQPGHKWNNAAFHNHTGLKQYPNYMMGGGYVVGGEVARMLVDINTRMHLKFTPIEDATLGFWLMAMDLRHIDHPRFYTWAAPCCFKAPVRKPGERFVTRFQLSEEFDYDLCSSDPWIILHKIDSPTKMRYVGGRVANCSAPARPWELAPSIRPYIQPEQLAYWLQRAPPEPEQLPEAADGGTPGADGSLESLAGGASGSSSSDSFLSGDAVTAGGSGNALAAGGNVDSRLALAGDASSSGLASSAKGAGGVGSAAGGVGVAGQNAGSSRVASAGAAGLNGGLAATGAASGGGGNLAAAGTAGGNGSNSAGGADAGIAVLSTSANTQAATATLQ